MFIPPHQKSKYFHKEASTDENTKVGLKSSHLFIHREIVRDVFGESQNVYLVYYPKQRNLMIAPVSDDVFKSLHKASQHMLKNRNLKGDKTIAIHELLIDNRLDMADRTLEYHLLPGSGILNVRL